MSSIGEFEYAMVSNVVMLSIAGFCWDSKERCPAQPHTETNAVSSMKITQPFGSQSSTYFDP